MICWIVFVVAILAVWLWVMCEREHEQKNHDDDHPWRKK
jgi:hypothetical protein